MANETNNATPRAESSPQHPFNKSTADLILRSADLVDFRVHSQILAEASPFFASMLTLPQPTAKAGSAEKGIAAGADDTTPIVPVTEDSKALDLLLRLVYPIPKPRAQMEDPHAMVPALLAAAKYEMALPTEIMTEQLIAAITKSPLQVWAAACCAGLESVARQAAEALKASWTAHETQALACMDGLGDMSGISAGNYYRLKRFLATSVGEGTFPFLSPSPWDPRPLHSIKWLTFTPFTTALPSTDVICRSSSRGGRVAVARFAAHQVVLAMRSPLLKARIAELRASQLEATATPESKDPSPGQIGLDFEEEADVLSVLLKACYDGAQDLATGVDLDTLAGVLVASRKYKMEAIAAHALASWRKAAGSHPLEAYFIALSHNLKECAEEAANALSAVQVNGVYVSVMESAPALAYHRLLQFHDSCCTAVKACIAQEIANVPGTLHEHNRGFVDAKWVTTSLNGFAVTTKGLGGVAKGELRKAVCNAMAESIARTVYLETPNFGFLHSLLRCVALAPDALDATLREVKLCVG